MNPLLLEVNINSDVLELTYRLQQGNVVSRKAGYGLCEDHVHHASSTIGQEPLKFWPVFLGARICFVCISSQDQNEDRQLIALKEKLVDPKQTYIDKQSGKDFDRPQYKKMLKKPKAGDLLYVLSI